MDLSLDSNDLIDIESDLSLAEKVRKSIDML